MPPHKPFLKPCRPPKDTIACVSNPSPVGGVRDVLSFFLKDQGLVGQFQSFLTTPYVEGGGLFLSQKPEGEGPEPKTSQSR